jgi:signal transduction histidine kinase/ABC-type branched-subunit amino acid transport system ATPase component
MTVAASPTPTHRPLLRARELRVRFGGAAVLEGVTLDVAAGELVVLTGEPGAGKTTLLRCLAGDLAPIGGFVTVDEAPASGGGSGGVAMVWQELAICENLDIASNVLLGRETRRLAASPSRLHAAAGEILRELEIPIRDTTQLAGSLTGVERQLLAIAAAMGRRPQVLLLDEPTASLGLLESAQVETLITRLRGRGTAIVLATREIEQMFRLAGRIVVLRHGRVVAEVEPSASHPDDVAAMLSGQPVDLSARRQLTRLHGLADRLVSADPSSSLATILSALGAALAAERVTIHVREGGWLLCAASLGLTADEIASMQRVPMNEGGSSIGRAVADGQLVLEAGVWSVPVIGPDGVCAAITVLRDPPRLPQRDELDLLTLYAGLAASAVERDRLLAQVTARNQVLETIREMLETLAGPVPVSTGLVDALASLMRGLGAAEVGLLSCTEPGAAVWRARVRADGSPAPSAAGDLERRLAPLIAPEHADGSARELSDGRGAPLLAVPFNAPGVVAVLVARWNEREITREETALIEDAAHSLRLALEREEAALAHQEAAALRRSREYQREFLSRLSHELRTPLTAIRGYASSLMAPDVSWDADSEHRFLETIATESARLGRLVDDLLDFSAIESGVMRLARDWCDLALVADAAFSCLPRELTGTVEVTCSAELPPVWADHDRLEQMLLNLLSNALRHNPSGTRIVVRVDRAPAEHANSVEISVSDEGLGLPEDVARAPFEPTRRTRVGSSAGAGLGLSITRGIVEAHGGTIHVIPGVPGTSFVIRLPIEPPDGEIAALAAHPPAPVIAAVAGAPDER